MTADLETLKALRERCRVAEGGDRNLDVALATALVPDVIVGFQRADDSGWDPYTHWTYTASIDAALALVKRLLPGWIVAQMGQNDDRTWWVELRQGHRSSYDKVALWTSKEPALALLAAALSARIAEMEAEALPRMTEAELLEKLEVFAPKDPAHD